MARVIRRYEGSNRKMLLTENMVLFLQVQEGWPMLTELEFVIHTESQADMMAGTYGMRPVFPCDEVPVAKTVKPYQHKRTYEKTPNHDSRGDI